MQARNHIAVGKFLYFKVMFPFKDFYKNINPKLYSDAGAIIQEYVIPR